MSDILTDMSGTIEANDANMGQFMIYGTEKWPKLELLDIPGVTAWFSGTLFPMFNGATTTRMTGDEADAAIAVMIARGKQAKAPLFWQIDPGAQPADLGQRLEAQGFKGREATPGMALRIADMVPASATPGLEIRPVRDADSLKLYGQILAQGFELPPFVGDLFAAMYDAVGLGEDSPIQSFIGWLDGEPIATSSVCMGAGVAGIYNIVTLPPAQRKGIGAAITQAAIRAGAEWGYQIAILQSSEMGYRVYERMGFVENCRLVRYVWMPY